MVFFCSYVRSAMAGSVYTRRKLAQGDNSLLIQLVLQGDHVLRGLGPENHVGAVPLDARLSAHLFNGSPVEEEAVVHREAHGLSLVLIDHGVICHTAHRSFQVHRLCDGLIVHPLVDGGGELHRLPQGRFCRPAQTLGKLLRNHHLKVIPCGDGPRQQLGEYRGITALLHGVGLSIHGDLNVVKGLGGNNELHPGVLGIGLIEAAEVLLHILIGIVLVLPRCPGGSGEAAHQADIQNALPIGLEQFVKLPAPAASDGPADGGQQ